VSEAPASTDMPQTSCPARHYLPVGVRLTLLAAFSTPLIILGWWVTQIEPPAQRVVSGDEKITHRISPSVAEVPPPPQGELLARQAMPMGGGMWRYRCGVDIGAAVSYYREEMPRRGWQTATREATAYSRAYGGEMLLFRRSGATCLIAMSETKDGPCITILLRPGPP